MRGGRRRASLLRGGVALAAGGAALAAWPVPTRSAPSPQQDAASLHFGLLLEARHAAWIRRLAGKPPVAGPFDEPVSRAKTTRIVDRTHFVMAMTSTEGPRFTG